MGTLRPAKAERAPREQVTATELGNRPAFPCALPFEHPDKCGMSLSMWLSGQVLPSVITGRKTPGAIADEVRQIVNAILQSEASR
jgi:hypothetical protein